jgi:hypothetical protein
VFSQSKGIGASAVHNKAVINDLLIKASSKSSLPTPLIGSAHFERGNSTPVAEAALSRRRP